MWKIGKLFKKSKKETVTPIVTRDVIEEDALSARNLSRMAYESIEKISSSCSGRPAGSKESRRAASLIASMYEDLGLEASMSEFSLLPTTGRLWPKVSCISLFASSSFILFGLPYLALLALVLAGVFSYFDGIEGRSLLSAFRKKGKGANVISETEPEKEVKETIVFSAHHDSAPLFANKDYKKDLVFFFSSAAYIAFIALCFSISEVSTGRFWRFNMPGLFGWIVVISAFVFSALSLRIWNLFSHEFSPGVGDNLTGEGVNLALAKYFASRPLENTRLVFLSFDSEETGHQGAKDYFKNAKLDKSAKIINIDGLYDRNELCFLSLDGNGSQKLSESLSSELVHLGKMMGYGLKLGKLPFLGGSTDAMEAAKAGYEATSITSMHPDAKTPAHTKGDTIEAVDRETLEEVIQIMIRYVSDIDRKNSGEEKTEEEKSFIRQERRYKLSIYDQD